MSSICHRCRFPKLSTDPTADSTDDGEAYQVIHARCLSATERAEIVELMGAEDGARWLELYAQPLDPIQLLNLSQNAAHLEMESAVLAARIAMGTMREHVARLRQAGHGDTADYWSGILGRWDNRVEGMADEARENAIDEDTL